jgi:hypothetical protein
MTEYIMTLQRLKEVSLGCLGNMQEMSYQEAMQQAKKLVNYPRLLIETELKQPSYYGLTEVIYPISEEEWIEFSKDPLAKYIPNVHVVDGTKYTAGI